MLNTESNGVNRKIQGQKFPKVSQDLNMKMTPSHRKTQLPRRGNIHPEDEPKAEKLRPEQVTKTVTEKSLVPCSNMTKNNNIPKIRRSHKQTDTK